MAAFVGWKADFGELIFGPDAGGWPDGSELPFVVVVASLSSRIYQSLLL